MNNHLNKIVNSSEMNILILLLLPAHFPKIDSFRIATNQSLGWEHMHNTLYDFYRTVEEFERKFYWTTFNKLADWGPKQRHENGISFVQSSLFLCTAILALSTELDHKIGDEIEEALQYHLRDADLTALLSYVTSSLPPSRNDFTFRWVARLVLRDSLSVSRGFIMGPATAIRANISSIQNVGTEDLTHILNDMVTRDSGGVMQDTFDEDDLTNGICAVLLTTMYLRPRWRSAPTVKNGTWPFYDSDNAPRAVRMIRINDVMRYADLNDWDAEAIEIPYKTPHLSLLLLVPRGNSLRRLAGLMSVNSLTNLTSDMRTTRLAVTIPLYTLRMTLLLPNKLKEIGITKLFTPKDTNTSTCEKITISHAVQRIMFWSEAGRNAFKDDGIEWDEAPEKEITVNRPYLFYVRWRNVTLINGNFAL